MIILTSCTLLREQLTSQKLPAEMKDGDVTLRKYLANSVNSLGEYTHLLHCLLPTFHLPFHPHFSIHKIIGMTQTFSTNNSIYFSVFSIKMRLQ